MVVCGDVRLPAEMVLETPDRGWRPLHDDGDTRWVADDAFLFGPSIRGQSASDFGLRSSAQLDGVPAPSLPTPGLAVRRFRQKPNGTTRKVRITDFCKKSRFWCKPGQYPQACYFKTSARFFLPDKSAPFEIVF
jgi:hypothetical protein